MIQIQISAALRPLDHPGQNKMKRADLSLSIPGAKPRTPLAHCAVDLFGPVSFGCCFGFSSDDDS